MERNIPVRLVQFRDADNQAKRYPPVSSEPSFVLHGKDLAKHVKALVGEYQNILPKVDAHLGATNCIAPAVISVRLNSKATAKSYRGNISALFYYKENDKENDERASDVFIGFRGCNEIMVAVRSKKQFESIGARLVADEENAVALSAVDSLEVFCPKLCDMAEKSPSGYKFKVVAFLDGAIDKAVHDRVVKALADAKGSESSFLDYAPGMRVYMVRGNDASSVMETLTQDGLLYSFEEMPVLKTDGGNAVETSLIAPKGRISGQSYPRLGIVDSGIKANPYTAPWLAGRNESFLEDDRNPLHGSMVASIALYGDCLEGVQYVGREEGIDIFDAQVFPENYKSVTELDFIRNLEELLGSNHKVAKVWNISVGFDRQIDDDRFSDFAIALDSLQRKHGILFCKSTGNDECAVSSGRFGRIHIGADSLLALTVGSVAHKKNACDKAEVGDPSPFTCIGPGVESTVKPEVAHFGGNAGISPGGRVLETGVSLIGPDGERMEKAGTSFATPRVAALAANLDYELGAGSSPLLMKALIVHSARYPNADSADVGDILDKIGYGVPLPVNDILHDSPDEATMVFQGVIQKSRVWEIRDFKMPQSLVKDGYYSGRISVTLAIDPILAHTQGLEYCQSTIDVKMGTYEKSVDEVNRQGPLVKLLDRHSVLSKGCYTTSDKARVVSFNNERSLIANSGKYWPIKKYAVDLTEMTAANRDKLLKSNRKWYLGLDATFRDIADKMSAANGEKPSVPFCLIVTVRDSTGRGLVNGEIARFLEQGNFVHENISIRSESRLRLRG
jgi:hypothetical protein